MKIALTQACLKVKCYFCFSIVADNVILATATNETKFRIKVFGAAFFKKGQYYAGVLCSLSTRATLRAATAFCSALWALWAHSLLLDHKDF